MSDVMLHGVLCMPPELWQDSEIDKWQRYTRYLEASRRIEEQQAEIERLKTENDEHRHAQAAIFKALGTSESDRDKWPEIIIALRAQVEALRKAFPTCAQHAPNGGTRSGCVICSANALNYALSRIDYLCVPENEMQVSDYDIDYDEERVVKRVEALRADAERFRWYFGPEDKAEWVNTYLTGIRERWGMDQWRTAIDAALGEKHD